MSKKLTLFIEMIDLNLIGEPNKCSRKKHVNLLLNL